MSPRPSARLGWGRAHGVGRLILHASDDGRAIYDLYGFRQTNGMRLS